MVAKRLVNRPVNLAATACLTVGAWACFVSVGHAQDHPVAAARMAISADDGHAAPVYPPQPFHHPPHHPPVKPPHEPPHEHGHEPGHEPGHQPHVRPPHRPHADGGLPFTGAEVTGMTAAALGLVAVGLVLVAVRRRGSGAGR